MKAIRGLLFLLALAAGAAQAHHLVDWTFIDLGTLSPTGQSIGISVNNHGDVIGYAQAPGGGIGMHGFLWQNGVLRDIGVPSFGTGVFVSDINLDGRIVGFTLEGTAATWKDGTWTSLGFTGQANAINRGGDVAGTTVVGAHERAVLLRDGVLTDLGTLGGLDSRVNAMNDAGHVVGSANRADGRLHAYLWANGAMRDLGSLDRRDSVATSINNKNVIVGFASDDASHVTGFLWYGQMFRLLPAFSQVFPSAINDRMDVVGFIGGTENVGFLAADGELVRLEQIPAVRAAKFTDMQPRAINEHRWIVGTGIAPSGGAHAFLLIPQPPFAVP